MSVKQYYILCLYLFCFDGVYFADTISSPIQIDTESGFGALPFATFNTHTNQFLVGFITQNSYCSLYDTAGNLVIEPTIILNSNSNPVPFSAPVGCYNSAANQFLVAYVGWTGDTSTYFSILDQSLNTLLGPVQLTNPDDDLNTKIVSCCYNSVNDQYLIVWTSACGYAYFVILDASGNILVNTTEINSLSVGDQRAVYVSYNATNNQYFFTWQDNMSNCPYFAIYDASGNVVTSPTVIDDTTVCYATFVTSAYNSTNNQFMVVWNDNGDNGYFVIYDATGSVVVPRTTITTNLVDITGGGGMAVCYNPSQNEYFISWNGNDYNIYYTIYSDQGIQKIPVTSLTSPDTNIYYNVLKSNACAGLKNIYWFGWLSMLNGGSDSKGYFALYTREIPVASTGGNNSTGIANKPAVTINYFNMFTSLPLSLTQPTNIAASFGISWFYPGNNYLKLGN